MAINNARNSESRGKWLHLLEPVTGRYIALGDIMSEVGGMSSSTVTHNIRDLVEQGLLEDARLNARRYLVITDKGRELMAKVKPAPKQVDTDRRDIPQPQVEAQAPAAPVTANKQFAEYPYKELVYLNMFVCGMIDLVDDFEPALQASSMQLRSAATMFRHALELDQQAIQITISKKQAKHKKQIQVRGY